MQVCTWIGNVVNYYATVQIHEYPRVWPKKTLIDYEPAGGGRDPILRWIDDDTLSIDLGEVRRVGSRIDKVGHIHINYAYTKASLDGGKDCSTGRGRNGTRDAPQPDELPRRRALTKKMHYHVIYRRCPYCPSVQGGVVSCD